MESTAEQRRDIYLLEALGIDVSTPYYGIDADASIRLREVNPLLFGGTGSGDAALTMRKITGANEVQLLADFNVLFTVHNQGGVGGATFRMIDDAGSSDWKFKATSAGFKIRDNNGADVVVIENGADENSLYIDAAGLVAMGHTDPHAKLDILDTTAQLRLGYDASNYTDILTTSAGYTEINPTDGIVSINTAGIANQLNVYDNSATSIGATLTASKLGLQKSATDAIRLDADGDSWLDGGDVGIGITAPESGADIATSVGLLWGGTKAASFTAGDAVTYMLIEPESNSAVTFPDPSTATSRVYYIYNVDNGTYTWGFAYDGFSAIFKVNGGTAQASVTPLLANTFAIVQSDGTYWHVFTFAKRA